MMKNMNSGEPLNREPDVRLLVIKTDLVNETPGINRMVWCA